MRICHSIIVLFCTILLSANANAQTEMDGSTVAYAFIGKDKAKGIGVLHQGATQWSIGLDIAIEGKRDDFTGGGYSEEDSWSVNAVIGFAVLDNENWNIIPFG